MLTPLLLALTIDWTVHPPDLLLYGGSLFAFFRGFLAIRDTLRDLQKAVGQKNPPDGLLGDVSHLQQDTEQHRRWLIRARLDQAPLDSRPGL